LSLENQIQFLAVALFKIKFLVNIFSASRFSSSRLLLNSVSFISKVAVWFHRVAKIGFKVFRLWFWLTLVLIGFVSFLRFCSCFIYVGFRNRLVFFSQKFWRKYGFIYRSAFWFSASVLVSINQLVIGFPQVSWRK